MRKGRVISEPGMADLGFVNGKVITVDDNFSIAQAVAVKGDRIVAIGTDEDINPLIGQHTKVLDLKGKSVLPGINDAHIHAALYGGTRPPLNLDVGYPVVKSIRDIVMAVSESYIIGQTTERNRSLIYGIYYFSMTESSALLTPLMGYLMDDYGFSICFTWKSIAVVVVTLILAPLVREGKS